jgi:hypothetical protein
MSKSSFAAMAAAVAVVFAVACEQNPLTEPAEVAVAPATLDGLTPGPSYSMGAIGGRPVVADMNDRFATEKTGANGDARVVLTQEGGIEIRRVKAKGLLPNHAYVLKVTVDLLGTPTVFSQTTTTNKNGVFQVHNFHLGNFAPGTYRVDIFVTHDHASGPPGFPNDVLGTEPLLACQPAYSIVVT